LFATPDCRHLALSTNSIEKISSLSGMDNLRILSLGRNMLKKIENVEVVGETLEELWLSYNQIEKLVRVLQRCGGPPTTIMMQLAKLVQLLRTFIGEYLLHVSTFATTRVALPTGVEPG
jgi:Leucine-rich repeat (LRR) protein